MLLLKKLAPLGAILLAACSQTSTPEPAPQDQFFDNITALCGKSFAGKVVSTDETDASFAKERLVMHVRDCSDTELRIPFNVGENRSRTWIITKTDDGLRLKHDHRHEDGHEDAVTMYGGDTANNGTATRQEFPVDQFSKDMFVREGLDVSVTNVWAVEIHPGDIFAYELRRPNRFFRVDFDLKNPVDTPPPSWGAED